MKKRLLILFCVGGVFLGIAKYLYVQLEVMALKKVIQLAKVEYGVVLSAQSTELNSVFPFELTAFDVNARKDSLLEFNSKKIVFKLNLKDIVLNMRSKNIKSQLIINDFVIKYFLPHEEKNSNSSPSKVQQKPTSVTNIESLIPKSLEVKDLSAVILLSNGSLEVYDAQEKYLSSSVENASMNILSLRTPVEFQFKGTSRLHHSYLDFDIPIDLITQFKIENNWVLFSKLNFSVFGMTNSLSGGVNWVERYIDVESTMKINDISSLPYKNFPNFPLKKGSGGISLVLDVMGYYQNDFPLIKGHVDLINLKPEVEYKQSDLSLFGSSSINLKTEFQYYKELKIKDGIWDIDLTPLSVEKSNVFKKSASEVLKTSGQGSWDKNFIMKNVTLKLNEFMLNTNGFLSLENESQFTIEIPKFKMDHLEKNLTFLPQFPMTGVMEAKGEIKGNIKKPEKLHVHLEKFNLSDFKYTLLKRTPELEIETPITLNLNSQFAIEDTKAKTGQIVLTSYFPYIELKKNGRRYKINEPTTLSVNAAAKNYKINISQFKINSAFANILGKGTPPLTVDDYFNFDIDLINLNWRKLSLLMPRNEFTSGISDLFANAQIKIYGKIDKNQILSSPVKVISQSHITIDKLSVPWSIHIGNEKESETPTKEIRKEFPKAFISNSNILNNINFKNTLIINKILLKDKNEFKNLHLVSSISNKYLHLNGEIGDIFSGKIIVNRIKVPLAQTDPTIQYAVESKSISFSPLVKILFPQFENTISGFSSMKIQGITPLPYSPSFKSKLIASGRFEIQKASINTINFLEKIKDQLIKIPQAVPKEFDRGNLNAHISSHFEIKNSQIFLNQFIAKSKSEEEIQAKGTINLNLEAQLSANVYIKNPPLNGDFIKLNQEKDGRLLFPIKIQGALKNPDWSFVGNPLEKMTTKFIENEKSRTIASAQKEFEKKSDEVKRQIQSESEKIIQSTPKRQIQTEVKKQRSILQDQAKRSLRNLFK